MLKKTDMLGNSFVALVFAILMVVVVFLAFQVQENSTKCKDARLGHQNELREVSRLLMQADTQANPFWKYRNVLKAQGRLEDLINFYGSITATSKLLKTDLARIEALRKTLDAEVDAAEETMYNMVANKSNKRFDHEFAPEAGLTVRRAEKRPRGG